MPVPAWGSVQESRSDRGGWLRTRKLPGVGGAPACGRISSCTCGPWPRSFTARTW